MMFTYEYQQKIHRSIGKLRFTLENLNPKAFEKEIRKKLKNILKSEEGMSFYLNTFPEPFIMIEEITYPINLRLRILRCQVLPKIYGTI